LCKETILSEIEKNKETMKGPWMEKKDVKTVAASSKKHKGLASVMIQAIPLIQKEGE